jgi:hypothetical protein
MPTLAIGVQQNPPPPHGGLAPTRTPTDRPRSPSRTPRQPSGFSPTSRRSTLAVVAAVASRIMWGRAGYLGGKRVPSIRDIEETIISRIARLRLWLFTSASLSASKEPMGRGRLQLPRIRTAAIPAAAMLRCLLPLTEGFLPPGVGNHRSGNFPTQALITLPLSVELHFRTVFTDHRTAQMLA